MELQCRASWCCCYCCFCFLDCFSSDSCWCWLYSRSIEGYLHLLRALYRWSSSSVNKCLVEHTVFALCLRVLMTPYFADRWWQLSQCKYMSVWVGFLKTVVLIDPSGCGITKVSRNGIDPSGFGSSDVNWGSLGLYYLCVGKFFFSCRVQDDTNVIHIPLPHWMTKQQCFTRCSGPNLLPWTGWVVAPYSQWAVVLAKMVQSVSRLKAWAQLEPVAQYWRGYLPYSLGISRVFKGSVFSISVWLLCISQASIFLSHWLPHFPFAATM